MADADIRPVASLLEGLALEHITHEFDAPARERFLAKNNEISIRGFVACGFRYHVAASAPAR